MKAFVTGISGFVGSHLAEHLLAAGDEVLGAARTGDRLQHVPTGVATTAWDISRDPPAGELLDAVRRFEPDVIYHLAAMSIPRDCGTAEPTAEARALNVDGVSRVLELAEELPRSPRVVFTSSSHVYAVDSRQPVVPETAPLAPRNAYGRTKFEAESLCLAAASGGADVVIVRSFSQAGPRQDPRLMLAEWARQLLSDTPSISVGNLHVGVDLRDVRDAVRALRALALNGVAGDVYNVGSAISRTTGSWFELLRHTAGDRRPVNERDVKPRNDPIADTSKLRSLTGWRPTVLPEQTVADIWSYWRDVVDGEASSRQRASQQQQQQ